LLLCTAADVIVQQPLTLVFILDHGRRCSFYCFIFIVMVGKIFVFIAVLSAVSALKYDEAKNVIKNYVESYNNIGKSLCQTNTCCNITSTESCSLSSFAKGQTTMVLPGGETRCIYSDSTPFAFQVIPGDSDKLLFYFQGGGACWDESSTKAGMCTSDSSPQSQVGIFDRSNANNKFKSHTVIHVSYCSGDVFGGNVVRPYNDKQGQPVVQKGLANSQSALDWAVKQQAAGALSSTLSQLVVMGCSAGSIGAQLWGNQIVTHLKWTKAAIVPDSYAGIFPDGTMGPLMYEYGFCSSNILLTDASRAKCNAQTLTLQEVDVELASNTPSLPYAFIQSKADIVQQSFFIAIGVSMNATQKTITPSEFYADVNSVFGMYSAQLKNFVTYLVDGDHHCFTNQELYYTADAKGPNDGGKTNTDKMMSDWVNPMPLSNGESISTVCEGVIKSALDDNTYCTSAVTPKTFVEKY